MAYSIPNGAVVEVTFTGQQENQQVMSVFHYQYSGGTIADGSAALTTLYTQLVAANKMYADWRNCIAADVGTMRVWLQWVKPGRYRKRVFTPLQTSGGVAENAHPVNVACAITKLSEVANRHGLGTVHMPGVPLTFLDRSTVLQDGLDAYALLGSEITNVITPALDTVYNPVLYNREAAGQQAIITEYAVPAFSRVMRRRTVGVGS